MGRPKKVYTTEDFKHGNFIEELPAIRKIFPCGAVNSVRIGKFKCLRCGRLFVAPLADAKRTQRKCCSYDCAFKYQHEQNLGTESHYLYCRWQGMRQRCLNPTNNRYGRYGARGVKISPEFDDFPTYVACVESLPTFPGKDKVIKFNLQLDRIDNNKGYYPNNLRWIDVSGNTANRNKMQRTNKYIGVVFAKNKKTKPWIVQVVYKHQWLMRKAFETEYEAALARDQFILDNKLPHTLNILSRNATTIPQGSTLK